jgi:L-aminoadipate-semialdehyde dehydrogenase
MSHLVMNVNEVSDSNGSSHLSNIRNESSGIPDPTSDLGWSDYRGAIHDIFSANAARIPNEVCVVETASETSPERVFTYRQINEASNLLAHHLVHNGIVRGDVVMVYAYRGVDLVVAVMGVLKAGATFSVIDPAYPPERQKIYLEVAQPRALVNIEKATLEAGPLSRIVRDYITKELRLKAEVPALRICNDGLLLGGMVSGQDVLDLQRHLTTQPVGVVVGPDSNPTLSFTSGSEGRPKGVLGRHFSLAYYFPWMSERFGMSNQDKFTMLSGIAHDPIQRDIFTPLFLGARLLVPSKEDIQHERLAEWMQKYGATVTHLTPAMGQILVGGASAEFPSLKRAFFVGDLLTNRDCKLLQKLAVNVGIVNMYGTTETQRAVSYYDIPSRSESPDFLASMSDIIPAGRGMYNVQLLVVDQTDRTKQCGVGQVGEIYVRAGGLAEGYLGDKLLNEKKFIPNWFVDPKIWIGQYEKEISSKDIEREPWREFYKGPRDRLYRTGDLGRYTATGDVECTGRADDQVKIRGFRIELGEINSHLSKHQLVRDNVTLVRRNKDEEPILVSYVVPELKEWPTWLAFRGLKDGTEDESMVGMLKRFKPLQDELRQHLKQSLPVYAVPTHFIPLKKLPLNPNGKVDKPALPFPDIADITAANPEEETWNTLSKTEQNVATIWGSLIKSCNPRTLRRDDSFFDIGGHSILAQRMLLMVKREIGAVVPMSLLFQDPTLKGFSRGVDRVHAKSQGDFSNTNGHAKEETRPGYSEYSEDARQLLIKLPASFPTALPIIFSQNPIVFLTGASGFLGVYLLRDLLSRTSPVINVIAHVRAKSVEAGLLRLQNSCKAYGVWNPQWSSRLSCVVGNLSEPKLGLDPNVWSFLEEKVDVILHNGAQVHWVSPYASLKATNVWGTMCALELCAYGKPKNFAYVSSTSVLDTKHYVALSEHSLSTGGNGVSESDDLQSSATSLGTGYGQTKWVSEYLVREAGRRGLAGTIIRPGYILGDSKSGVTNTDDFLIRMLKGCIQLSSRPNMTNTINMVPVDHVARVVTASAFHPPVSPLGVAQVTSHPRLRFIEFLGALEHYGYQVLEVDYPIWRDSFEQFIDKGSEEHAL